MAGPATPSVLYVSRSILTDIVGDLNRHMQERGYLGVRSLVSGGAGSRCAGCPKLSSQAEERLGLVCLLSVGSGLKSDGASNASQISVKGKAIEKHLHTMSIGIRPTTVRVQWKSLCSFNFREGKSELQLGDNGMRGREVGLQFQVRSHSQGGQRANQPAI